MRGVRSCILVSLRVARTAPSLHAMVLVQPDAPLWEHDGNGDEYIDADEGVGIEGDLDVEDDD